MPLAAIGYALMDRFDLLNTMDLDRTVVANALVALDSGYRDTPFHNRLHGADVAQSLVAMLVETR